ncbi:MAG: VanZ family protein [Crocinitomicaceae bacterium]|jgi:VanZ family protein|nr:VanZ family protein [Crocinitomicaceae bacterium]
MFRGRRFIFLSALVVFVAITALSLMPPRTNLTIPTNDKVGHFIAYAVFSLNILLLGKNIMQYTVSTLLIVTYGILIEFLQSFVGRETSFYDFLANSAGVSIGIVLFLLFRKAINQILLKFNVIS